MGKDSKAAWELMEALSPVAAFCLSPRAPLACTN